MVSAMQFALRPLKLWQAFRPLPTPAPTEPQTPPVALPAVGRLDGDEPDDALADWLDDCAHGPRFGPKLVALAAARDGDESEAFLADGLAGLAQSARASDRDLTIVDARGLSDRLATTFDRRIGPRSRRADPFGASARVEIVALTDVVSVGPSPNAAALRKTLDLLAADSDLVVIALPDVADWPVAVSLLAAADEIVLLRDDTQDGGDETRAAQYAAARLGIRIAGAIALGGR